MNNIEVEKCQEKLKSNVSLSIFDRTILDYTQTHIGNALLENHNVNHKSAIIKKAKWYDRVKCQICDGEFTRSARSNHNRTKVHRLHEDMNSKIRSLLLGKNSASFIKDKM